eukprot:scaffold10540_cov116-Isochrysis_galbana.AAC.14
MQHATIRATTARLRSSVRRRGVHRASAPSCLRSLAICSTHRLRICPCSLRARSMASESRGVSAATSAQCDPPSMATTGSVSDKLRQPTPIVAHGSRVPYEKRTREPDRASQRGCRPYRRGRSSGRGSTPHSPPHSLASPSTDQLKGGKKSVTLLAPMGWITCVHDRYDQPRNRCGCASDAPAPPSTHSILPRGPTCWTPADPAM